jgi:diadenosine tetraphosphate (Ap4A) HIT family hydrolase
MSPDCPYCPPLDSDQHVRFADGLVLYLEDERHQGALQHSGIIVPVRHAETVFDLTQAEVTATFQLLARAKEWLDAERAPDGYNVGWNAGAVAGQEVFHAHLHVIPRFRQEPMAGRGIRAHLKGDDNRW